ncbi:hypothetical protein FBU59_004768 [Linderina macrospora]|uniref:Uncharacterized protein n=1 Tax=Linderina macrospora TaxID=4868 RepID=A0ACC1J4S5_9FUNG|nr:hypothetical protein FBU59_004768 [Linderina macrospora]
MVSFAQITSAAVLAVAVQAQRPGAGASTLEFSQLQKSVSENWSSYYNFITSGLPVLQKIRTSEYGWLTAAFGGTSIPLTYDEAFVSKAILGGAFGAYKTAAADTEVSTPTAATEEESEAASATETPAATSAAKTSDAKESKATGASEASELSDDEVESGASSAAKPSAAKPSATKSSAAETKSGNTNGAGKVAGSLAAAAAVAAAAFF